ncbi:MAG: LexA family transcriptional regulator [Alphaproteobacteria bacterium]|nr:LexA family transcriptional regulator [Alphaproteobacteria bacterium]
MRGAAARRYELLVRRIDQHLSRRGLSERQACLRAGLKVDAIRAIRRGQSPRAETLARLARILEVPAQLLFDATGGEGLDGCEAPARPQGVADRDDPASLTIAEIDLRVADRRHLADAVTALQAQAIAYRWRMPRDLVRAQTSAGETHLRIIAMHGDSMEPDLPSGTRILVDSGDRTPSPPGMFVVWDGLGLVVKRIEHLPFSDPPRVRITSDNPRYRPYEVALVEAEIRGRVIGRWKWS